MKRIIVSLMLITLTTGALAFGATRAFFSDTETSTGNTFTAGAIDLKIDNSSYGFDWNRPGAVNPRGVWGANEANSWGLSDLTGQLFFNFKDLKPGDYGEDTISLHVQNDAWACMAFNLTETPENGVNEPEAAVPDLTVGPNQGELQNYLEFVFWNDDGDNVLEVGESVIPSLSGLAKDIFTGGKLAIADSSTGGPLPAATEAKPASYIGKGWCFGDLVVDPEVPAANQNGPIPGNTGFTCNPAGNHNSAQTDGISVDVTFDAVQARHNERFTCDEGGLGCNENADVMFVLDSSGSIDAGELAVLQGAAVAFATALNPSTLGNHIGVVDFDSVATLLEDLTDVIVDINNAIALLVSGGLTNLGAGITTASAELADGDDDRPDGDSPDYMVIITDGNPQDLVAATAAANAAKAAGTTIYVVGIGADVNSSYLETIASAPSLYFSSDEFDDLETILDDIADCELEVVAP